jgi:hypothetical protein
LVVGKKIQQAGEKRLVRKSVSHFRILLNPGPLRA